MGHVCMSPSRAAGGTRYGLYSGLDALRYNEDSSLNAARSVFRKQACAARGIETLGPLIEAQHLPSPSSEEVKRALRRTGQ